MQYQVTAFTRDFYAREFVMANSGSFCLKDGFSLDKRIEEEEGFMGIMEWFQKGGPVMYLLLLCSVCVVAILIERFMFYRKAGRGIRAFTDKLPGLVQDGDWKRALQACEQDTNAAAFVAKEGLAAVVAGRDTELALEMAYGTAASELRSGLNYLSMIVTLSPLLGLLGTIVGMINSFNIFNLQAGQPLAITGGIGEALIATATGLCVAILALVVHSYFAQKMDTILTELDKVIAVISAEDRKRR